MLDQITIHNVLLVNLKTVFHVLKFKLNKGLCTFAQNKLSIYYLTVPW